MDNVKNGENNSGRYVYNIMEGEVMEEVKSLMSKITDMCKCEICVCNICAIALNKLKPFYVTTQKGELFARAGQANMTEKTEIKIEVVRAIEVVRNKKMHD